VIELDWKKSVMMMIRGLLFHPGLNSDPRLDTSSGLGT
jgi:hypothetical protein